MTTHALNERERFIAPALDERERKMLTLTSESVSCTALMWTAKAIGYPNFELTLGENRINRVGGFSYLGYHLTSKLGWEKMIMTYKKRIIEQVRVVRSCRIAGTSSLSLRHVLFTTFVKPLVTWLCCLFPLLTDRQRDELGHFYFTCMKRGRGILSGTISTMDP